MKIVLAGGTGQIGTILARAYHVSGDAVVVLSRNPQPAPWRAVAWDARTLGAWTSELEDADVVIGLAGRSVNCRYTAANRREILTSRVDSTRALGQAIARAKHPPRTWLQMSTATTERRATEAHGCAQGASPARRRRAPAPVPRQQRAGDASLVATPGPRRYAGRAESSAVP